jgi:hypothetical protein
VILEAAFVARFYNLQIPILGIVGKQNSSAIWSSSIFIQ